MKKFPHFAFLCSFQTCWKQSRKWKRCLEQIPPNGMLRNFWGATQIDFSGISFNPRSMKSSPTQACTISIIKTTPMLASVTALVFGLFYRNFMSATLMNRVIYKKLRTSPCDAPLSARFWNNWTSSMFEDHPIIWKTGFRCKSFCVNTSQTRLPARLDFAVRATLQAAWRTPTKHRPIIVTFFRVSTLLWAGLPVATLPSA